MATAYSDPNSDITFNWSGGTAPRYAKINSGTRQPTSGESTTYIEDEDNGGPQVAEFGISNPSITGTISQIKLWLWWNDRGDGLDLSCRVKLAGSYTSSQNSTALSGPFVWKSLTWSGSWDASTAFSGATIELTTPDMEGPDRIRVGDAYLEITYSGSQTYNETGSGGALGNSTARVNVQYRPTLAGGSTADSTSAIRATYNLVSTGGSVCSGQGLITHNATATGGAQAGGSSSLVVLYRPSVSGGARASGTARLGSVDFVEGLSGGAAVGGSAVLSGNNSPIIASGGARASGTAKLSVLYRPSLSAGAKVGGLAGKFFSGCSGLLCDEFWGDDGLLSAHTMDSGDSWTASDDWRVESDHAICTAPERSIAYADAGTEDYTVSADITLPTAAKGGVVFRVLDTLNYWAATIEQGTGAFRLLEVTGGSSAQMAFTLVGLQPDVPIRLTVLCSGSTIIATVNGIDISATATTFLTETKTGLFYDLTPATYDNFSTTNPIHNITALGGSVGSGAASISVLYSPTHSGGGTVGGDVREYTPYFNTGTGGAVVGGHASSSFAEVATGGATVGGTAKVFELLNPVHSGGAVCSGVSNVFSIYVKIGSGGAKVSGTASVRASNESSLGDSLRLWLTGASADAGTQTDSSLSLGNYRSRTEATRIGFLEAVAIPNVVVLSASRSNGIGTGGLAILGEKVAFAAPNGTLGSAKTLLVGFPEVLEDGSDPNKWVRVVRTTSEPLRGLGTIEFTDQFNNAFGMDNGTNAGGTTYRAVMVSNDSLDTVTNVRLWINPLAEVVNCQRALPSSGAGELHGSSFDDWPWAGFVHIRTEGQELREICYYSSRTSDTLTIPAIGRGLLGTSPSAGATTDTLISVPPIRIGKELASPLADGNVQTIATETSPPISVSFAPGLEASPTTQASLAPHEQFALWIERQLPAGIEAFPELLVSIGIQFTVNGQTYRDSLNGMFRISNAALERFELHIGTAQEPDLSQAATETFSSLPFTTSTVLTGPQRYYLVVNERHRFNLVSQNVSSTIIELDENGEQIQPSPSAPVSTTIEALGSGAFLITSQYYYLADSEGQQADQFRIYVTFNGSEPLTATPVDVDVTDSGGVFTLSYTTAIQSIPTTARAVVRTLRSDDDSESENTNEVAATSISTSFGEAQLKGFWREVAEQRT